ncbi:MAG: hypothetical protein ACM357_04480 [Gemmatimonadota bacterium]
MFTTLVMRCRKRLAAAGVSPAAGLPASYIGDAEAVLDPARLLEDTDLRWHAVGPPAAFEEPVAFLDGTQRMELLGYAGSAPLALVEVRAAVRERAGSAFTTVVRERQAYLAGRRAALDAAGGPPEGVELFELPDGPGHPFRDLAELRRAVDRVRGNLELAAADAFRRLRDGWLIIDGSLSGNPRLAEDPRAIGLVKGHATLPFDGADLERYLRLPCGHRTSLFEPTPGYRPVVAWGLRLWPWEQRDLFHGLVRVEVAPANGAPERADRIARAILAERLPVSGGPQWDRLLYGTHTVQQYLRAE